MSDSDLEGDEMLISEDVAFSLVLSDATTPARCSSWNANRAAVEIWPKTAMNMASVACIGQQGC